MLDHKEHVQFVFEKQIRNTNKTGRINTVQRFKIICLNKNCKKQLVAERFSFPCVHSHL